LKFTKAIVRPPSANFADGLTTVDLGKPDYELALRQHEAYCRALESCGLTLTRLAADDRFPDATFVEDTAVLIEQGAVIARPGAASRTGESETIAQLLRPLFPRLSAISGSGTLDAGDVCEAGDMFFIGVSHRTNEEGARQLASFLADFGHRSALIDIRGVSNILHLKSGLAYLGGNRLLVIDALKNNDAFSGYELIAIDEREAYAANCLLINDRVLMASGFPALRLKLDELDYEVVALDMSEFQKMDGGLSCLSLRF
jgi:dimethylargininase